METANDPTEICGVRAIPELKIELTDSPYIIAQREAEKKRAEEVVVVAKKRAVAPSLTVKSSDSGLLERIAQCESKGNYKAQNPRSTASGKYQFIRGTWGNYGGYRDAKDAPPEVQDEKARQVFAEQGSSPWNSSRSCWAK